NVFERHGIRRIDPRGDRFDPNLHQAMFEVERADAAPGTVVEVVQPGYVIHERVLRPAMVGVAKAPSAAASGGSGGGQQTAPDRAPSETVGQNVDRSA